MGGSTAYWCVQLYFWLITLYGLLSGLDLCEPLNELCLLFFMVNQYIIRIRWIIWFIPPQSNDLLKLVEPRQKLANTGYIIKAKRWCWKHEATDRRIDSGRSCQTSTPLFKSYTCCSLCLLVRLPLSLANKLWHLHTLIHLCPSSGYHLAQVLLIRLLPLAASSSLTPSLPSSFLYSSKRRSSRPCMKPIAAIYHHLETMSRFPHPAVMRSRRYILPTFIY